MTKRTDIHSPSNFIPEDYRYVMSFCNGQNPLTFGFPINNDLIMSLRQTRGRDFANIHGGNYDCDVCGKAYNEGECWEHVPTGQLITLGHQCAHKYSLYADDQLFEREKASAIAARKRQQKRERIEAEVAEIFAENEGLETALETDHYIVRDIKSRLYQWGSLSAKQIGLVMKLAREANRREQEKEELIDVPVSGRTQITGRVVFARWEDFGPSWMASSSLKALIMVDTPEGTWKTWGTIPSTICDDIVAEDGYYDIEGGVAEAIKGRTVTFTATFKVKDTDPKMSFFSRPSKGTVEAK